MTRFIMPIILIGIATTVFFVFTNPLYNDVSVIKTETASYDEALSNSKVLENERDKLTKKYNDMDANDLMKLEKLLPENVDNVRLVLEIEKIALPYGMVLKDVKYNTNDSNNRATAGVVQGGGAVSTGGKDYGTLDFEFSTSGNYDNFINFIKDLQNNLRVVDISSISFSSETGGGTFSKTPFSDVYKYNFKIRTYWLKN